MPGGVSSPVRALGSVGGGPVAFVRGRGAHAWDADGTRFVDLQMAFGPLLAGHAHPRVVQAVQEAAADGLHFGALHPREVELAKRVVAAHPAVERLRFVNSGTEAVMSATRLARAATGRDRVLKFEGGYHGHADSYLADAGSGLATLGIRSSPGVPADTVRHTATLPLDDEDALEEFFLTHGDRIACAVVEGVPANDGLLPQRIDWHRRLRALTRSHGALLVVDEVITGFRLAPGGATEALGLEPDLVTLGKVLGGGLPVGAYGGRSDLMARVAPEGDVYQAGTLSGSPVAMAAGLATLDAVAETPDAYTTLARRGTRFAAALRDHADDAGLPLSVVQEGSLLWLRPDHGSGRTRPVLDPETKKRYGALHRAMRRQGVFLPPSAHEVAFLSTAHDDAVLEGVAEAFAGAVREVRG